MAENITKKAPIISSSLKMYPDRRIGACIAVLSLALLAMTSIPESDAVQLSEQLPDGIVRTSSHVDISATNSINAEGVVFERTAIIEFTNDSGMAVRSFTLWLPAGYSFESFKTERGWTGQKSPQGMLVFASTDYLNIGESVKFGIKTDMPETAINWKATDKDGNTIKIGKTAMEILNKQNPEPPVEKPVETQPEKPVETQPEKPTSGILNNSTFRIIPEKPNVGSTIRVVGESFEASQQFSFYIDANKLGTFVSDENGNFVTTMKIPDGQKADRVNFRVIDTFGNEKNVSLRLAIMENRVPETDNIKLTLNGLPPIQHRGDVLHISGTGQPHSAITVLIKSPEGEIINTRTAEVDAKGNWAIDDPITVPLDVVFGMYSAEISDGRDNILRTWEVKSSKVINITPDSLKSEPGDVMRYTGTALPNISIEFVLEDPLGKEIASNIVNPGSSGSVIFEYQTELSSKKGTYTLIAKQEEHKEFIFTGLGQLPDIPIKIEFDKLNYRSFEDATISLTGNDSEIVNLLIIDPSDKPKGNAIPITLKSDGRATYILDLNGYKSGVYTAVVNKGSAKSIAIFTVGLEIGSGDIEVNTTRSDYKPGEPILILGNTAIPNTLIRIAMIDPDGNEIKVKDTFSDKNGKISDSSFRIPTEATQGKWSIKVQSGSNFSTIEINVAPIQEGISITISDSEGSHDREKRITIHIAGAGPSQNAIIEIISPQGEKIQTLEIRTTSDGASALPWTVPADAEPGIYTIKVQDAKYSNQTTHEIK